MSLLRRLSHILQLKDAQTIVEETKRKLKKTWMIVNGIPVLIADFVIDAEIIIGSESGDLDSLKNYKFSTLEKWLPEAGLYSLSDGSIVYLTKHPRRQWLLSFNENYYETKILGTRGKKIPINIRKEIYEGKRKDICVDAGGVIYYLSSKIGYILNENTLMCTDSRFRQELIDWGKENG